MDEPSDGPGISDDDILALLAETARTIGGEPLSAPETAAMPSAPLDVDALASLLLETEELVVPSEGEQSRPDAGGEVTAPENLGPASGGHIAFTSTLSIVFGDNGDDFSSAS